MKVLIEACCGSVEEAVAAEQAGADRIELCAGLPTGGVTPSIGMIEEAREKLSIPIVAMVRPREGRPNPPEEDFRALIRDIRHCLSAGADEVICGVLDSNSEIDFDKNLQIIEAAKGSPVAFHRVFDMTSNLELSLESLIEIGFRRVLTSGCPMTVNEGFDGLKRLTELAGDRIMVLPGGGVRPGNIRQLVNECGCREVHFSFRKQSGAAGYGGVQDFQPDLDRIREAREILDSITR